MSNFIEDCLAGDALLEDIDDYVDAWHDGDTDLSMAKFLGMTEHEYSLFVENPEYLFLIVKAHRDNVNIKSLLEREISSIAARAESKAKADRLTQWLKREGLWE